MKNIYRTLFSVLVTAGAISGTQAADLNYDYPILETSSAAFDWSGFYAGIYAGYGAGRATSTGEVSGFVTPVDVKGALLGGTVGANVQSGNLVFGAEGELAWSGVTGSATCVGNPTFDCNGTLNWLGSGKLRGGVAFDNVLLFGTAGIAAGGITATVDPIPAGATGTYSSTVWGWTVGGGAELAVSEQISVKAEYGYYDFASTRAPVDTLANSGATDIKSHTHVAKLGVNYRF